MQAEQVLRHGLAVRDLPRLRWLLGDALYEQRCLPAAQQQYEATVQSGQAAAAEEQHAVQQLIKIHRISGNSEQLAQYKEHLKQLRNKQYGAPPVPN